VKREHWLLAQKTRRSFITKQEKGFHTPRDGMKTGWNGMCSSFCLTYKDKDWMYPHTNCYSGLGRDYKAPLGAVALVIGITEEYAGHTTPHELRLPYLDWVLNESPWAASFVTKSAAQCLRMHTVVQDTTVPGNLMVGGSVAIRRMWEQTSIFYLWNDLVKAGVNKTLAYILAHIGYADNSQGRATTLSWSVLHEGGHMNLAIQKLSMSYALNFMKGVYWADNSYHSHLVYTGYSHMFGVGENKNPTPFVAWVKKTFQKFVEEVEGEVKAKAVVNPFAAAMSAKKTPTQTLKYSVAIERMAAFAPLILKEIGYEQR
jgi:hypothetical protein